ncbi:MAG: HNH endonuclease [Lachnospiraceae bacterium]|jgi:hypothetical protein|nr:HNH endonuclease [Lachnospiraceae bacterium]
MAKKIDFCYLCGKSAPKPSTRDHILPKSLFPKGEWNATARLTMPTHLGCNTAYSADEQYLSTIILPSGIDIFPDALQAFSAVKRNWNRDAGKKQLASILKHAKPVEITTPGGIVIGKAIGIEVNVERVDRAVWKIARGIISYDTRCFVDINTEKILAHISTADLAKKASAPEFKEAFGGLFTKTALHYQPVEHVAIRRCYYLVGESVSGLEITASLIIMLYTSSYIIQTNIVIEKSAFPSDLVLLGAKE